MMKLSGRLVMVRRVLHLGSVRMSWQWYYAGMQIFAYDGNTLELLVSYAHRTSYSLVGLTVEVYTDIILTIMTESILQSAVLFGASSRATGVRIIRDLTQSSSHVELVPFDKKGITTTLGGPRGKRSKGWQSMAEGESQASIRSVVKCLFTLSVFKIEWTHHEAHFTTQTCDVWRYGG